MRRLPILSVMVLTGAIILGVLSQQGSVMLAQDATGTPTAQPMTPMVVPITATPAAPVSDGVNLTIYNVGTALVQDRRTFTLKSGISMLDFTDVASSMDSTSVSFKALTDPAGTSVLEQNYVYDLVGERKQIDFKYISNNVIEETFEIHLRNRKENQAVEIRVPEHMYRGSNWEIINSSDPSTKLDSGTTEFRVEVQPGEEKIITYTVRYTWPN